MDRSRLNVEKIKLKLSLETNEKKITKKKPKHMVNKNYLTMNIVYNTLGSN